MKSITSCLSEWLHAYLNDELEGSLHEQLFQHLEQCTECRDYMAKAAGSADDWATARDALASSSELGTNTGDRLFDSQSPPNDLMSLLRFLSPSDDPRAAGRIGAFEITGIVGSGGMGIVLKARDPALDRFIAIKILAPHLASSPSARKRFAREARAAAAVIHDNVIPIYQVAEWNGLPYLVMPYLPDPSLQQRLDNDGILDVESVLSIGMQVARGLEAAHSQGLVHRDVKPANVLLSKGTERAIITDFGLARAADDASLTQAGLLTGTPHYMSPEQARGEAVDQKSDLFSLGSLLFAMIAGHPPIHAELGSETIERISKGSLPSLADAAPGTPIWFVHIVDWLHQSGPQQRPQSANQVAGLLEQCLAHHRQPEKYPLPNCLVRTDIYVWPRRFIVTALLLASLATGLCFLFLREDANERQSSQPAVSKAEPPSASMHGPSQHDTKPPVTTVQESWGGIREELNAISARADELQQRFDAAGDAEPSN